MLLQLIHTAAVGVPLSLVPHTALAIYTRQTFTLWNTVFSALRLMGFTCGSGLASVHRLAFRLFLQPSPSLNSVLMTKLSRCAAADSVLCAAALLVDLASFSEKVHVFQLAWARCSRGSLH